MIDLKKLYTEHPECFADSVKFASFLRDLYPDEKGKIYILSAMLSNGVLALVKGGDSLAINRFYTKLEGTYGFDQLKMKECFQLFVQVAKTDEPPRTAKTQNRIKIASTKKSSTSKPLKKSNKELKYPKFSESYIRSELASQKFLARGRAYFQQGKVHNLTCNSDLSVFESDVEGSYDNSYHCTLYINRNELDDYECECEAFANIPGPCKHIVATMLKITECRVKAERELKAESRLKALDNEKKKYESTIAITKQTDDRDVLTKSINTSRLSLENKEIYNEKNSLQTSVSKIEQTENSIDNNFKPSNNGSSSRKSHRNVLMVMLMIICIIIGLAGFIGICILTEMDGIGVTIFFIIAALVTSIVCYAIYEHFN